MTAEKRSLTPRVIIHGGAGNILRENLPPRAEEQYREALIAVVEAVRELLNNGANALDTATFAVAQLEDNPLFNAGRGAVFTRTGTNELEASVMLSNGSRKRGVGVMRLTTVKNPVRLAREMLLRGEAADGGGAQMHCQLSGEVAEHLAEQWGMAMVKPSYFWTRKRWEEHRRGLGKSLGDEFFREGMQAADFAVAHEMAYEDEKSVDMLVGEVSWNGRDYLPQGTVGAVVMDSSGTICAATSTGGLTNKLPGRIGDTPTLGAGFWSEEWLESPAQSAATPDLLSFFSACLQRVPGYGKLENTQQYRRAVGMSGTGNGDSFLRINAVRTAAAIARFSSTPTRRISLHEAVKAVAGANGLLQQSAGERWRKTGEGEGGIIGIEFDEYKGRGYIVQDFNCGGMFRGWIDDTGNAQALVFKRAKA